MKKRFTEGQIVGIVREAESGEKSITQICRQHGISDPTFYAWRRKFSSMSEPEIRRLWELEKENARLKSRRAGTGRTRRGDRRDQGVFEKKVGDVAGRRRFVAAAGPRVSARRASELLGLSRRWRSYLSRRKEDGVIGRLKELAARFPRFGYRRLHAMLRREGCRVNLKRVRRLCRVHGLKLSRKVRRKRRGIGLGVPCRAEYPNHIWAYDFLFDQCENGRKLKVLTVEDEFTRLCPGAPGNSAYVGATLLRLFKRHGTPAFVRSDNGPEFIARALMRMLKIQGVECRHIEPGSPWQNGLNERFNGSYRDECANLETFHNRDHPGAPGLSQLYKRHYNQERPHPGAPGAYQTPVEFAARQGIRKEEEDVANLSHCASSGCIEEGSGPKIARGSARQSRRAGISSAWTEEAYLKVSAPGRSRPQVKLLNAQSLYVRVASKRGP